MRSTKAALAAGDRLGKHDGDVIRRLDDDSLERLLNRQRVADFNACLARRLQRRAQRAGNLIVEVELALFDGFEGDIRRHDLCQRGRMPEVINILCVKNFAGGRLEAAASGLRLPARWRTAKSALQPRCQWPMPACSTSEIQSGSAITFGPGRQPNVSKRLTLRRVVLLLRRALTDAAGSHMIIELHFTLPQMRPPGRELVPQLRDINVLPIRVIARAGSRALLWKRPTASHFLS